MVQHVHMMSPGTPSTQKPESKAIQEGGKEGGTKRRAWDRRSSEGVDE